MKYTTMTCALLISAAMILLGCVSIASAIGAHLVSEELIHAPATFEIGKPWMLAFPIAAICLAVFTDMREIRKGNKDLA